MSGRVYQGAHRECRDLAQLERENEEFHCRRLVFGLYKRIFLFFGVPILVVAYDWILNVNPTWNKLRYQEFKATYSSSWIEQLRPIDALVTRSNQTRHLDMCKSQRLGY